MIPNSVLISCWQRWKRADICRRVALNGFSRDAQRDMPLIARWRIYAAQDDAGVLQALFNIATGEEIFI